MDTVVDSFPFQHWSEVVSYPVIVEGAEAYEDVILELFRSQVIYRSDKKQIVKKRITENYDNS